jgi:hypothetical protein
MNPYLTYGERCCSEHGVQAKIHHPNDWTGRTQLSILFLISRTKPCFISLGSLRPIMLSEICRLHPTAGWPNREETSSQDVQDFLTYRLCPPSNLWLGLCVITVWPCVLHMGRGDCESSWSDSILVYYTLFLVIRTETREMLDPEWRSWEQWKCWPAAWGWAEWAHPRSAEPERNTWPDFQGDLSGRCSDTLYAQWLD